jgi:hypothetical protein
LKFTDFLDRQLEKQDEEKIEEKKVESLLKHKLKKLQKKHGYISNSMLTKKEIEQLKKKEKK